MSVVDKDPVDDSGPSSDPPKAQSRPANLGADEDGQPIVIFWEGPTDHENPQNWSSAKKGVNVAMVSLMGFMTPLASSFFAPSVKEVLDEFGSNSDVYATFVVSVYVLGWALGPLVIAPLSELYGRMVVYHVCNAGFICFTIGCALATDLNMLMGFRFLQGAWGVAPLTIGPGSIADMVTAEKRGAAMSLWACGPFLG